MKEENVTSIYLFQIDSAKENRHFFESVRDSSPNSVYFRGLDFRVGPWTPDGVRVDLEMGETPQCTLVLIELEAAETTALRSSRKYLHENSTVICSDFMQYLHRIIKDCDSRADSRELNIALLIDALKQNIPVTVKTAAALRSSNTFLEESLLTDQASPSRSHVTPHYYIPAEERTGHKQPLLHEHPVMQGVLKLDPEQSKSLRRCVLILDAIIQEKDHRSRAIFNSWRIRAPLKRQLDQLKRMDRTFPALEHFVLNQKVSGVKIDFETLLSELIELWVESGKKIDNEVARSLVESYFPIAAEIKPQDDMNSIFDAAHLQIGSLLEGQP